MFALGVQGLAYNLICAFFCLAVLGMAANEWQRIEAAEYGRIAVAASVALLFRIAAALAQAVGWTAATACQEGLIESLTVAVLIWAFLPRVFSTRRRAGIFLGTVAVVLVASAIWCLIMTPAGTSGSGSILSPWSILLLLLSGFALLLWVRQRARYSAWLAIGFSLSLLGGVAWSLDQPQVAMLLHLAILPLFTIETYRTVIADLGTYEIELQEVSERTLQQTQDMAFLLEVNQTIAASLDLSVVLDRVSESVARTVNADWAYVLLPNSDGIETLSVAARYGWWGKRWTQESQANRQVAIHLSDYSLLQHAILRRRQVLATRPEDYEQFDPLHKLLARPQSGPTLIQPIFHQSQSLGAMLLGHIGNQRTFSDADARLCQALMSQVATAIDNARLYQNVDRQARQLSQLLRIREEEATQRQAILESINEGVVVAGDDGSVVMVNAAAERILASSREQLLGQTIKKLYAELLLAAGRKTGKQAVFEWEEKIVMGSLAPVRMPEGPLLGYVAVFRDVTQERQAEQSKSRFVATISHELRTPMTSIKGYVELLAAGAAGQVTAEQRRYLDIVNDNTERMVSLVNNLIAVSEMEKGTIQVEPKRVDMKGVIQEAVQAVRSEAAERQLNLSVDVPADLKPAQGDPTRLRQIMDNLLDNALRFTPPAGRITVWATEAHLEDNGDAPQSFLVVSVRDTGVGIPAEEHGHIFEKFHRVPNPMSMEAGGSGIGLAIVKSLVEAHGGRIWVDSQIGEGSTFSFVIPTWAHMAG